MTFVSSREMVTELSLGPATLNGTPISITPPPGPARVPLTGGAQAANGEGAARPEKPRPVVAASRRTHGAPGRGREGEGKERASRLKAHAKGQGEGGGCSFRKKGPGKT